MICLVSYDKSSFFFRVGSLCIFFFFFCLSFFFNFCPSDFLSLGLLLFFFFLFYFKSFRSSDFLSPGIGNQTAQYFNCQF
jgi:hypothetical protein